MTQKEKMEDRLYRCNHYLVTYKPEAYLPRALLRAFCLLVGGALAPDSGGLAKFIHDYLPSYKGGINHHAPKTSEDKIV